MPLDERVARRILMIRENLSRLESLRAIPEESFLADFRNVEAAKHLLQTSIEAVIDIAVQALAQLNEPLPDHHADIFEALARHGVVPPGRLETYRKMVGFRNRVVHLYERVDDRRVWEILQTELADFESFIAEIVAHHGA
jgi:uncharacterized protein YutE (UPF0331/DUF86 family)